ncbi:DUF4383 domain-containing protein [Candidatus Kaiserbacteria bacterium]|nr:DUF4383 domain-containing protein [Candidatus Kaiserbacteria bacterium]
MANDPMVQKLAWVFGIVFLVIGLAGFVPSLAQNGMLLGIFEVDPLHNVIHLLSGALAIGAVLAGNYARLYFQVFGVVYAVVAVVGFMQGDTVLGLIAANTADHMLHLVIAAVALYVGFGMKEGSMAGGMQAAM